MKAALPKFRTPGESSTGRVLDLVSKYGVLFALLASIAIFSLLKPDVFFTLANMRAILSQVAPLGVLAFGLTVVLAMGDFDLSIAGMVGLGSAVVISLIATDGVPYQVAILAGLGVGVVGGMINGMLVAYAGASSFVITLAFSQVFQGAEFQITGQKTIIEGIPKAYSEIANGSGPFGIANQFYIMLGVMVVLYLLLEQSKVGRQMYAVGGNREAAHLAGVQVRRLRCAGFVIVALCAVTAAVLISAQQSSYSPNMGQSYLLPSFAAAFLGAAVLKPGRFTVLGTLVGALLLEVIATGLIQLSLSSASILLIQGAILAIAVLLSRLGRNVR
jgi:ribose transport system permease protein